MQPIDRRTLDRWRREARPMTVVDVLPRDAYREYHLPGAINVPVGDDDFDGKIREAVPDREATVVVYCANRDCDASPKAAERMEALGYAEVYDYEAGKEDWKEAGLPVEKAA